jgi:ribonucleoside-diphosphate reductase alpha chain
VLALEYLGMTEFAQVKPADGFNVAPRTAGKETTSVKVEAKREEPELFGEEQTLSKHLSTMMGDAPFCNICGHVTVRNGVCYKCMNCGNSMGCS